MKMNRFVAALWLLVLPLMPGSGWGQEGMASPANNGVSALGSDRPFRNADDDTFRPPKSAGCLCPEYYAPVECAGAVYSNPCFAACAGARNCTDEGLQTEDPSPQAGADQGCFCAEIYEPVLCEGGVVYANACFAACAKAGNCQHSISVDVVYQRFVHPRGEYVLEYPNGWGESYGLQTLILQPADRQTRVSIGRYPIERGDSATAEAYIAEELRQAKEFRKRINGRDTLMVAGREAERLVLSETVELQGWKGEKLPGPMVEVIVVVPQAQGYYVLRLATIGEAFDRIRPAFDRIVGSFTLGSM